jgi:cytochrome c551/c552
MLLTLALAAVLADAHEGAVSLLRSRCVSCHGPDKQKGGLRLDGRAALLKGGEHGPAAVPGDAKSLLLRAVRHESPDLVMPPKERLSADEVAALERWVRDGAPWAETAAAAGTGDAWSDPANPIRKIWGGKRLDLWSLRPPAHRDPPPGPGLSIDRFVRARLGTIPPSPEADRRTLIRRLSFDLTGLPPSPEEVEAFESDPAPDAWERLVDRLLASPRYGERWARHWLDVVRYADTNGFERDEFKPLMHRYRDYVVRSLNADKPFDVFVREQLAGDEAVRGVPKTPEEADRLVAVGFLRLGTYDSTQDLFDEKRKGHNELMADLVNTAGQAFLGLTFACANCHDHKYDPISQADHFRFRAFFAGVQRADDAILDLAPERARLDAAHAALDAEAKDLKAQRDELLRPLRDCIAVERREGFPEEVRALLDKPEGERSAEEKKTLKPWLEKLKVSDADVLKALDADATSRAGELEKAAAAAETRKPAYTRALSVREAGPTAPETRLFYQGDLHEPREVVPPGFLSVLDPNPAAVRPPEGGASSGRRAALAEWIASASNPFTARVIVNRLWRHHFGRGLVATPDDFGYAGARPTHPELLDWLALELVRGGWSLKRIHRAILLSETWRQSSRHAGPGAAADPDNRLLWRQHPRRLEAETIRDAMLAVSGLLLPKEAGPPLWPPVPDDLLEAQPGILEVKSDKGARDRLQGWMTDPEEKTWVRSLFLVQKRVLPLPFLEPFDLPDMTVACGKRDVTVVAPQALQLLNSGLTAKASAAFAARIAVGPPAGSIRRAFRLALGRPPTPAEEEIALRGFERWSSIRGEGRSALVDLCRALLNVNEFIYLD